MTFIQFEFVVLLVVTLVLTWVARTARAHNLVLLVASAIFYGWIHPWFLALLVFSTALDFVVGLQMVARPERKGALLLVSLAGNLGLLGVFKYLDFFISSVAELLGALGVQTSLHTLGIFLPAGISFFTFQTLSYSLDIYRGRLQPSRDIVSYAAFVSMFPQLVAGPIERARDLLPQLEARRVLTGSGLRSGLSLALWGATKKVVVADTLSPYVDRVFVMADPSASLVAAAAFAFAVQILADFSGYTDIARGAARMMGMELMENFDRPYMARSPSDFWRRWHISLSSWFHEYVYIPLGGSRGWALQTAGAVTATMLLSGLWHGASWNFVLWGAYHGALLTLVREGKRRLPGVLRPVFSFAPLQVGLMYLATCLGWLIFRQRDLDTLLAYARLPLGGGSTEHFVATAILLTMTVLLGGLLALGDRTRGLWPRVAAAFPRSDLGAGLGWGLMIALITLFSRDTASDFIYFRF